VSVPRLPDFVDALGDDVFVVDTGFQRERFDAAYLVLDAGRAAFIDTGTGRSLPRLLAAVQALGLERDAVDWVIPTHVHLDHAGGAGHLMRELPNARLLVHPRGVRHMVDPGALWMGATTVYGAEEMQRSYGEVVPVAAERVVASHDGMVVVLGTRPLRLRDTPGHARHHHCIWDERTQGWFTGDSFGLSYREFDNARGAWILPTSTPVQFEPEALQSSIEGLLASRPRCMYLTHYGRVDDVARLGGLVLDLLRQMVAMGRAVEGSSERHRALVDGQIEIFARSLNGHGHGGSREEITRVLALDLELNAQGMAIWLDRR
jgi:glyoxylase-like metal-dependent hydrolase (beta-lactamase superfamily II)